MAKKKPIVTAEDSDLADGYYAGLQQSKVAAGLSLADATEVTTRQRAEDEANGSAPYLETEPEETPEA